MELIGISIGIQAGEQPLWLTGWRGVIARFVMAQPAGAPRGQTDKRPRVSIA